jgi:uncharacterized membrane protein (DUF106 family)
VSVHALVVFLFNNPQSVQSLQGVLPVADQLPSTHGATHTPSVSVYPSLQPPQTASAVLVQAVVVTLFNALQFVQVLQGDLPLVEKLRPAMQLTGEKHFSGNGMV